MSPKSSFSGSYSNLQASAWPVVPVQTCKEPEPVSLGKVDHYKSAKGDNVPCPLSRNHKI